MMSKGEGNKQDDVQNEEVPQPFTPEVAAPPTAAMPNVQLAAPIPEMRVSDNTKSSSTMQLGPYPDSGSEILLSVCRQQQRLATQQLSCPSTNPGGRCSSGTSGCS
jgi:hypothetical protein